jgi:hypothetical protein
MEFGFDPERLSFLDRALSPAFQLRVVRIPAGGEHAYAEQEWLGAIVVVERGQIDIECLAGGGRRFETGAVLFLVGLPLRALVNRGLEEAVLSAVSRRRR